MRITDKHIFFWDSIYSNWYMCPIQIGGIKFNCSEQYFMYKKALTFNDAKIADKILESAKPSEQKKLGKAIRNYDENLWAKRRYDVMLTAVYEKFKQNKDLLNKLLATNDRIFVEASPYDCVWGVGLHETNDLILDEKNWRGLNLLGKALCEIRHKLRNNITL